MSYSTILTIEPKGDVVPHTEILNGTLAMTIWNHISKEYGLRVLFGEKPEIWSWCGEGKLKRHHDIVMAFTFDHVIVFMEIAKTNIISQIYDTIILYHSTGMLRNRLALKMSE